MVSKDPRECAKPNEVRQNEPDGTEKEENKEKKRKKKKVIEKMREEKKEDKKRVVQNKADFGCPRNKLIYMPKMFSTEQLRLDLELTL